MIQITINRRESDAAILAFKVVGHAEFAEYGNDIVCAGVSAVTFGSVNAIERLTGYEPQVQLQDSGWFSVRISDSLDKEARQQVNLLLEAMVVMLETIQDSYGDYVELINE